MKAPGALGSEQAGPPHAGLLPTGINMDRLKRSAKNFHISPQPSVLFQ